MGRFVPINVTTSIAEKRAPINIGAKTYYDGKQCWQYKVVYDRPGSYTFTVPSGVNCVRSVLVGGGGKPKCVGSCCAFAGAGGAYSEKFMTVTAGNTIAIVVGKQEQDTTLSCNAVSVHTAGGAAGCVPGVAAGGDWNSKGGCAGYTCNNCGGSLSHFCGSCKCLVLTACCGYCIVFQCDQANGSISSTYCNPLFAGGGSAGSPFALCGGQALNVCGLSNSGVAGGGAGIGDYNLTGSGCSWHYTCCTCICPAYCDAIQQGYVTTVNYPGSAGGGGGTCPSQVSIYRSWDGICTAGTWRGGPGGPGGSNRNENWPWTYEWGYNTNGSYPFGSAYCWHEKCERYPCAYPETECWWDIQDIKGSGSPGTVGFRSSCIGCIGIGIGPRPVNAGEGAGTGGIYHTYITSTAGPQCLGYMIGPTDPNNNLYPLLNWCKICQLGTSSQCDQAWLMPDSLFPFFVTCAGTLGGSGGVGWYGYTSKAGKGGGGGHSAGHILCVCWGGAFDCCNQVAATPLAFPPCLLDTLVSNAGTGMAIIYYREA